MVRKRKVNENESGSLKQRIGSYKEDVENKQIKKKGSGGRNTSKKKVLEEATNSKLREVQIRIEDCLLQNGTQSPEVLAALRRQSLEEESRQSIEEESKEESLSPEDKEVSQCEDQPEEELPSAVVPLEKSPSPVLPLEDDSSLGSSSNKSAQLVSGDGVCGDEVPVSVPDRAVVSAADECAIVSAGDKEVGEVVPNKALCSSRGDDDGPLSSSSPSSFSSRMELGESSNAAVGLLRFPDDRSDSGVSSLRSTGSGDERSGSRSSALSSSDEPQQQIISTVASSQPASNRSPLFVPTSSHSYSSGTSASGGSLDSVRVWRGTY